MKITKDFQAFLMVIGLLGGILTVTWLLIACPAIANFFLFLIALGVCWLGARGSLGWEERD